MTFAQALTRLAWGLLLGVGAVGFALESGLVTRAVQPDLTSLPQQLGPFEILEPLDFDLSALGEKPPEGHAFLAIRDSAGHAGRLFLAYYARSQRWSGRPHDLEGCFAAAGWEEREAHRLTAAPFPWSRRFEGPEGAIRVVHWIDHPGNEVLGLGGAALRARLTQGRGLRADVISAYFEFAADDAPDEAALAAASTALSEALEERW